MQYRLSGAVAVDCGREWEMNPILQHGENPLYNALYTLLYYTLIYRLDLVKIRLKLNKTSYL